MKNLNRYLREQRYLDINEIITEGRLQNMNDNEWLTSLYCGDRWYDHRGMYIQPVFDITQNFALYGIDADDLEEWKNKLKANKGISKFRQQKLKSGYAILSFHYDAEKDQERQDAINNEKSKEAEAAKKFEEEVKNADTTKYTTNAKHIQKMKDYFNKRSDPERLVKSIKDDDKLVARWIAAMKIDWPEAISCFAYEIAERKLLTKAEVVAYSEKYKADEEKVDDTDMKRLDKETKKISESWITKSLYKYFESLTDYEITWKEAFKNAKTQEGRAAMNRNGRAWTEGFIVTVKKGDKTMDITFDIVTNEGGGLYGYCMGYNVVSLKDFKQQFEYKIKNL